MRRRLAHLLAVSPSTPLWEMVAFVAAPFVGTSGLVIGLARL